MFERVVEVGSFISYVILFFLQSGYVMNPSDTHVSYLPLAHMFERIVQVSLTFSGRAILVSLLKNKYNCVDQRWLNLLDMIENNR